MKTTSKRIQESNEKLIQINQMRLKPALARSRIDTPVIIDSSRSSQHGPAVAFVSVGATSWSSMKYGIFPLSRTAEIWIFPVFALSVFSLIFTDL
jgi:hypothetical protein